MAWYRTGTATFTNGSRNVVGIGTAWVGNVRPGDEIIGPNGASHEVETITSDTALTMVETYAGSTSTSTYKVKPTQGWARDVSVQLAQLLNDYGTIEAALNVLNGNLGIGTATPTSNGSTYRNLDLRGSGGGGGFVYAGETTAKARFGYGGAAGGGLIEMLAAEPLIVKTSTAEALRVASSGNVGIGTASPGAVLHVNGTVRLDAATTTSATAGGASALPATPAGYLTINVAGTDRKMPFYA